MLRGATKPLSPFYILAPSLTVAQWYMLDGYELAGPDFDLYRSHGFLPFSWRGSRPAGNRQKKSQTQTNIEKLH